MYILIERERGDGRERNTNPLLHWFTHPLADSCLCPDSGLNPQPQDIRMMLQLTELPSQCQSSSVYNTVVPRYS